MKNIITSLLIFLSFQSAFAQKDTNQIDVNSLFSLQLDSIALRNTIDKWGTYTFNVLYYQVKNISNDTLIFIRNTCFYYNHSRIKIENIEFDLNSAGSCYFNSYETFEIASGNSIKINEWVSNDSLNNLESGDWNTMLTIPLVKDSPTKYRVNGINFFENKQYLIFNGKTTIVKSVIDKRKRRNKR
jgi:hypothetical protein